MASDQPQLKEVIASFGGTLPPWVMDDGRTGILIDLLRDCLEPSGYKVKTQLVPYARRITEFQASRVDIVTDMNEKTIGELKLEGYFSGNIYAYDNFLFSLSDRNIEINKIQQLSKYSLLSWQGAIAHIGGEYAKMAKRNKKYSETASQKTQLRMLFNGRTDFIQMDGSIYKFYRDELIKDNELNAQIAVKRTFLFGRNPNGFLFKDITIRDACVSNMNLVSKNKKYQDILYFDN